MVTEPKRSAPALEATAVLPNRAGLHARSAAMLVKAAAGFDATITIQCDGRLANARSLTELLRLGARQGHEITIHADGEEAEEALQHVRSMIESGFDEE